ncbi:MAG: hypothetical protein VCD00_07890 [Candidatus Hydrogenedentota bacterium]
MTFFRLIRAQVITMILLITAGDGLAQPPSRTLALSSDLPSFVLHGEALNIESQHETTLSLEGQGLSVPIDAAWHKENDSLFSVDWTVPDTLEPGQYNLISNEDRTRSSNIYVLAEKPETIRLHFIDRIESLRPPEPVPGVFDIAISFRTADTPDRDSTMPVVTVDSKDEPQSVSVGDLNLLLFDANNASDRYAGNLHLLRRQLKQSPHTIGISRTPPSAIPFRTQLILFEDDPLQALVFRPGQYADSTLNELTKWNSVPLFELSDLPLVVIANATGIHPESSDK